MPIQEEAGSRQLFLPMNTEAFEKLLPTLKAEVADRGQQIDPENEHDFKSLVLGWAIGKGLSITDAKRFMRHVWSRNLL